MRGTPGREPHIPYQIQTILTKYGIVCPFKRNLLTAEGQHFICPLSVGYILISELLQDMTSCPSAVNKYPFKGTNYSIFVKECLVFGNIICCPFIMYWLAPSETSELRFWTKPKKI